ncbi:MAG: DASH family cryptochrome [Fluviicola sp.]|nr:DASH family cryptochrome [Fluviicola sp.]
MKKLGIVWFKTDLRLHDNETLATAIQECEQVLPVYCFDEALLEEKQLGFKRTSAIRLQFLLETLKDLDQQLREKGSGLMVLKGKPEEELPKLAKMYGATKVFAKREVCFEEKQIDALVEKALWKEQCVFETYSTSTMYNASDLPFSIKNIPDVFTTFRKRVEHESEVRAIATTPSNIKSPTIKPLALPSMDDLGYVSINSDERSAFPFKGGETNALNRLQHYLFGTHHIKNYKETRNELIGLDYSSKFSAWLANGSLSPKMVYHQVKNYEQLFGGNESTYWLVFELLWRDFFRFAFKKHQAKLFHYQGIASQPIPKSTLNQTKVEQWINGKTGDAFVDANMIELKTTGFMSNRGRQNVASFFIHELEQDWRYGAAYFEQQLIDYDPCSNWGNWAYLAGVGHDPRAGRKFDTEKQAATYDKNKLYRQLWLSKTN